jgi:hypothetical protein
MPFKTYLSADEQWMRTLQVFTRFSGCARFAFGALGRGTVYLGQIATTHRLFVPGDVVLAVQNHGGGSRIQVYAVSSKGFVIRGMYLKYETSKSRYVEVHKRIKGVKSKRKLADLRPTSNIEFEEFNSGPLRLVEHPESLEGQFPDSPLVRRYVVEALRAR